METVGTGRRVVLAVGETLHLRRGKDRIIYAGMPSENVYSIIERKAEGYAGFSWNLFYPRGRQDITIDGVSIFVERVSPEEIELRVA